MSLPGGPQDPYSTPQQPAGGVPVPPPPPPTPYGAPVAPPAPYGAPAPGYGGYGQPPAMPPTGYGPVGGTEKNGLGTWALILGILSIVCIGLFGGIPAVILGKSSKKAQALGQANNANLGNIGMILGWIGIALSVLGIVFWIVMFIIGSNTTPTTTFGN
jgi:hypothetical protein